jgi:hypothetical protein
MCLEVVGLLWNLYQICLRRYSFFSV